MKVRVPSGVADGQKLRVPGKGGKGLRGGRDGDLYLDIQVAAHPVFASTAWTSTSTCRWRRGRRFWAQASSCPRRGARDAESAGRHARRPEAAARRPRHGAPDGTKGDLYAQAQIAVPTVIDERSASSTSSCATRRASIRVRTSADGG
jgi:DnaJ-class molecular chaperone